MSGDEQPKSGRLRDLLREIGEIFAGIFHVYRAWWVDILVLSFCIFVPIGLLDAADNQALESIGPGHDLTATALGIAALVITATALLGEVFLAGAVGLSLIHAEDGRPPSLRFIARHLSYGRLIAVDILFVLAVALGLVFLVVPGMAAFAYLALAGPVVEIEDRGIASSFRRSFQLVRGRFWLVFLILFPIEAVGGAVGQGSAAICETLFGHTFFADGIAEALADIAISPLFAIASVLLARKLIMARDGIELPGPGLRDLQPAPSGKPPA